MHHFASIRRPGQGHTGGAGRDRRGSGSGSGLGMAAGRGHAPDHDTDAAKPLVVDVDGEGALDSLRPTAGRLIMARVPEVSPTGGNWQL